MSLTAQDIYATVEATWPPARQFRKGAWTHRDGAGGGKRVSSSTAEGPVGPADIAAMEAEAAAMGQPPLVMIRDGEATLDAMLAAAGYAVVDPVVAYAAPVAPLAVPPPPVTAFAHWPRLAVAEDIWATGGIGPGRLAVMDRAPGPKAALLARSDDTPSGAGFIGVANGIAMIHALEVAPRFRRKGAARNMIAAAACWAAAQGAEWLTLVVTERNAGARALYSSLGMAVVGHYHYRIRTDDDGAER